MHACAQSYIHARVQQLGCVVVRAVLRSGYRDTARPYRLNNTHCAHRLPNSKLQITQTRTKVNLRGGRKISIETYNVILARRICVVLRSLSCNCIEIRKQRAIYQASRHNQTFCWRQQCIDAVRRAWQLQRRPISVAVALLFNDVQPISSRLRPHHNGFISSAIYPEKLCNFSSVPLAAEIWYSSCIWE